VSLVLFYFPELRLSQVARLECCFSFLFFPHLEKKIILTYSTHTLLLFFFFFFLLEVHVALERKEDEE
jgi:hypothetical protein